MDRLAVVLVEDVVASQGMAQSNSAVVLLDRLVGHVLDLYQVLGTESVEEVGVGSLESGQYDKLKNV